MHMAGSPTRWGFPGMQVKPLFPSRRTTLLPCVSVSTIFAVLATLAGPADIARAILTSVESPLLIDELRYGEFVRAALRKGIPARHIEIANVSVVRLTLITFTCPPWLAGQLEANRSKFTERRSLIVLFHS